MKKSISRKNILRGAGALLIIVLMILSSIVVTANTTNKGTRNIVGYEGFEDGVMPSAGWTLNDPSSNRDITSSASMKIPENRDIIFTDDFNDNIKDYSKWTEIYTEGIWEEINQRAEFQCYESGDSSNRYEGIESSEFIVAKQSPVRRCGTSGCIRGCRRRGRKIASAR